MALRPLSLGLGLALLGAVLLPAPAQDKNPLDPGKEKANLQGDKHQLDGKEINRLSELRSGNRDFNDDKGPNGEVLAKAAQFYVYRLTEPKYWDGTGKKTMNDLVKEASGQLLLYEIRKKTPPLKDTQKKYLQEMGKEMVKCLREVFAHNDEPIVRVNAARILAGVAETGLEESADTLLALLANPRESDAVKLWALHGLRDLLAAPGASPDKSVFKNAATEAKCILAAQEFLTRKVTLPEPPGPNASDEDKLKAQQERDAFNFVRREAVRALAESRHAIVPGNNTDKGRTAWWLLCVARKHGLTPEPNLSEQVEAAIGACRLQPSKDLQLDYVAYQVGKTVAEFVTEYAKQKAGGEGAGLPWKLYTARLTLALSELQGHARPNERKYVDDMVKKALDALKPIELGKDATAAPLEDWLNANAPASKTVYNGVAETELK